MTDKSKHIAHIIFEPKFGGLEFYILGLLKSNILRPYKQSIICTRSISGKYGDLSAAFRQAGAELVECTIPPKLGYRLPSTSARFNGFLRFVRSELFVRKLMAVCKNHAVTILQTHINEFVLAQAIASMRQQLTWVWTVHDLMIPNANELDKLRGLSNRVKMRVVAVSPQIQERLSPHMDMAVALFPGGVDLDRIPFKIAQLRTQNLQSISVMKKVVFGLHTRLVPDKGLEVLLEASAFLIREGLVLEVLFAGDGILRPILEEKIRTLSLADYIKLLGSTDNVASFLEQLDVFVLPSFSEGFPLSLIEALAAGLPFVATAVGAIPTLIGENAGIIVPPRSVKDLAEAMRRMLVPETRARYAQNAMGIAQKYTTEICAEKYAKLYSEIPA